MTKEEEKEIQAGRVPHDLLDIGLFLNTNRELFSMDDLEGIGAALLTVAGIVEILMIEKRERESDFLNQPVYMDLQLNRKVSLRKKGYKKGAKKDVK